MRQTVAVACLTLLATGACRQVMAPPPLKEDPALARELLRERTGQTSDRLVPPATVEEAARLEASLERTPDDLRTRQRLLMFYAWTGKNPQSWNDTLLARRRHVAWLVSHAPDSLLLATFIVSKKDDPEGYRTIRALWLAHIAQRDATMPVLDNASMFFRQAEPEIAEALLLRMQASPQVASLSGTPRDPAIYPFWMRLGSLYAGALDAGDSSPAAAAYAARVRQTLESSSDASLLAVTAASLLSQFDRVSPEHEARRKADGTHYLHRAFEIDPRNNQANYVQRNLLMRERWQMARRGASPAAVVAVRPIESDGSSLLACLAEQAYIPGRSMGTARTLAEDALRVADLIPPDRSSCDAEFRANLVLAFTEWEEGHRAQAVTYLLAASRAPAPALPVDVRRFPAPPLEGRLLNSMLKNGERESIIEYLERSAASRPSSDGERMRKEAAAIRAGRMPERYQRALFDGQL